MMGGSGKRAWWEGIAEGMSDPALVEGIPVEWLRRAGVVPLRKGDGGVAIAGAPGTDDQVYEDLTALLGVEAEWVEADAGEIRRAIDRSYFKRTGPAEGEGEAADGEREAEGDWGAGAADLLAGGDDSPVVRYVNGMLLEAVKRGASDIHIEPFAGHVDVRYRIDGTLYAVPSPPARMAEAIAARVKVMARLNLAEKRLPQDGATRLRVGTEELDVRVSCVPVAEGERIVLRLLHREATRYSLTGLGMGEELLSRFREVLAAPHGIVLVTGPTGSGKTTTLYAALRELDTAHRNVMTIEDPVEYQLEGIGQMQVHPQIGLTFSSGLRHILRQDPDVILVGETRDLETAEIVVRASLTGHLVFTTLHTNDAVGAVSRLTDMGVPPYLLAAAARAVLAQRLVRKVCPTCGRKASLGKEDARRLGVPDWAGRSVMEANPAGCGACLGGYCGRTGIHELLPVTAAVAEGIRARAGEAELRRLAAAAGWRSLVADGLAKMEAGITTAAEILRATGGGTA